VILAPLAVSKGCVDTRALPYPRSRMTPRHLLEPGRLAGAALLKAQSDARLVDMTRAGNDRAFEAIVDRYKGALVRYCSRILPDGRAEDAVQQTFLNAYRALHRETTPLSLRGWLFGIAHNVSLNVLRQRGASAPAAAVVGEEESAHASLERRERLREVLAAIAALPPGQRDALLLRELEGRGHEEIARELGVSGGAARQLISRARNGIRQAAAALVPVPLVMRLTDGSAPPPTAGRVAELTAAGAGVTVSKVVATAAVSGTLLGGAAVTGPDLVEGDRERGAADIAEAASGQEPDRADAPGPGRGEAGDDRDGRSHGGEDGRDRDGRSREDDDRSGSDRGREDDDDRSGPGSGDDDDSGPGSDADDPDAERDDDSSGPGGGEDERSGPGGGDNSGGGGDNSGPGGDGSSGGGDNSGPGGGEAEPVDVLDSGGDDAVEAEAVDEGDSGPGGGD
jgi:RNA polymerase sigma factor (sigma-70 family)